MQSVTVRVSRSAVTPLLAVGMYALAFAAFAEPLAPHALTWFTQPGDQTVSAGTVVAFGASCRGTFGGTITAWHVHRPDGTPQELPGNGGLLVFNAVATDDGNRYSAICSGVEWVNGTFVGVSMESRRALLTVLYPPTVVAGPAAQQAAVGATVTFAAQANGNPSPGAQWQASTGQGGAFADIPSATQPSLSFVANAQDHGRLYRVVFANSQGSAASTAAALTIVHRVSPSAGLHGTLVPGNALDVVHGTTVAFTVVPEAGYLASMGGSCGGSLSGTTFTTAPITSPCTVTASFVPNPALRYSAASPTGTGLITATLAGGGPACSFTNAQFIPVAGGPGSPPAGSAPAGYTFPHGLFDFSLGGCAPGAQVTVTVVYPTALPPGTLYWKYGPRPGSLQPAWYTLPAALAGNVAMFTIADGGVGDDDLAANGTVVDQGGPGTLDGADTIPTLSGVGLPILSSLLLLAYGVRAWSRRPRRGLRSEP